MINMPIISQLHVKILTVDEIRIVLFLLSTNLLIALEKDIIIV